MKYFVFALLLLSIACSQVETTKISQWRGVNRDGIYNESNVLKNWDNNGPKLLWETDTLGFGYGSPTVLDGKIYVNGEIDSVATLFAFNMNGNLLWTAENGPEFMGEGFAASFPGARSTPTIINNLAYTISGMGNIACFETLTGAKKWSKNMTTDFNGKANYFGYSESPLIDGNKIFCLPGGKDTNMVALDRMTGDIIWVAKGLSDTASYCSPMLIELATRNIVVNFTIHNLLGFDAETGELLWSHAQKTTQFNQPSNTPIFKDGHLYYVASDGNGAVKLKLSDDGTSITEVWQNETSNGTFTGFLIHENKLYNTTRKMQMEVRELNNGEIIDSLRIKEGTIISDGIMLYCYSQNGSVNLISTTDSLSIISKFKIKKGSKEHFSTPVISNGVMYIRHGEVLQAYAINKDE